MALGTGYLAGAVGVLGWPSFPAAESIQWLFYFAIAAAVLGILQSLWPDPLWLRWGSRLLLTTGLLWFFLEPIREYEWEGAARWYWLVGLAVAMLGVWASLGSLAERLPGASLALVLIIVTTGTSVVALRSGFAKFAQLGGVLTATLGACWLIALRKPSFSLAPGGIDVVAVILCGLWLGIYFFAEMPAGAGVLLALAPSLAWLSQLALVRKLNPWVAASINAVLVAVPVVIAILVALDEYARSSGYYE